MPTIYDFTWSTDGNAILFVKYEKDQSNLYTADTQSSSPFAQDSNDVVLEIAWQPPP